MSAKRKAKKKTAKRTSAAGAAAALTKFRAMRGIKKSFWKLGPKLTGALFPKGVRAIVVVQFNDRGKINHAKAHRSTNDEVYFNNLGRIGRTLTLSHWPFIEPERPFFVPAKSAVGPFHLDPSDPFVGTITVYGDPPFGGGGGPGDPQFDAGN